GEGGADHMVVLIVDHLGGRAGGDIGDRRRGVAEYVVAALGGNTDSGLGSGVGAETGLVGVGARDGAGRRDRDGRGVQAAGGVAGLGGRRGGGTLGGAQR